VSRTSRIRKPRIPWTVFAMMQVAALALARKSNFTAIALMLPIANAHS
jgi:hypothetical protein